MIRRESKKSRRCGDYLALWETVSWRSKLSNNAIVRVAQTPQKEDVDQLLKSEQLFVGNLPRNRCNFQNGRQNSTIHTAVNHDDERVGRALWNKELHCNLVHIAYDQQGIFIQGLQGLSDIARARTDV